MYRVFVLFCATISTINIQIISVIICKLFVLLLVTVQKNNSEYLEETQSQIQGDNIPT
jgi:hypothetical protein